ncbi:MAG: hypothetical protein ACQETE_09800 [Bacteroidota bacterium]
MKYYRIEIDEEVHKYLLEKIQDFNDTPNSILRRELLQNKVGRKEPLKSNSLLPDFPIETPVALQHILEVIFLVKIRGFSRVEATKSVAKRHRVRRETVSDKYGRQLNKSTSEVDQMLDDQNLHEFKKVLIRKFSNQTSFIDNFFQDLIKRLPNFSRSAKNIERKDASMSRKHISLDILKKRGNDLVKSKPFSVKINNDKYDINSWTELDETVVNWLIKNELLKRSSLPIYATSNKYFLNIKPSHTSKSYDGKWKEIVDGIFIDTKFNAPSHIRNILNLIEQLSINEKCNIKLAIK